MYAQRMWNRLARTAVAASVLLLCTACGKSESYNDGYQMGQSAYRVFDDPNADPSSLCFQQIELASIHYNGTKPMTPMPAESDYNQSDFAQGCLDGVNALKNP
jgi:hypothetical protein